MSPSCRSDKSNPSFYAAVPDPCDNCRFTTCFSLHTYSALSCPYNLCPECRELVTLDAQIADVHILLVNLSQKRHDLKGRINRRHDRLTSRLPLEVISHIFTFVKRESERQISSSTETSYKWDPVSKLGAVCKRWRAITLDTPQLWTNVIINPQKQGRFPKITKQWLSRSRALPFALEVVIAPESVGYQPLTISTVFRLLRSHASRWRDLTLNLSMDMINYMLGGLEEMINVESLTMNRLDDSTSDENEREKITMKYPFVPKRLHIHDVHISLIPLHFDRLTYLEAHFIEADELLYIFQSAPHLHECTLQVVPQEYGRYTLPLSPIVNDSVTVLTTWPTPEFFQTIHYLRHLTLPSLEILRYKRIDSEDEMDALAHFLDRSQPPLTEFGFCYDESSPAIQGLEPNWYSMFPSMTSLELSIDFDDNGSRTPGFIQGLSAYAEPMVLPCLRNLTIGTARMSPGAWNDLSDIFPDHKNQNEPAPAGPRPLKTISIHLYRSFEMSRIFPKDAYYHLRAIQESGVAITVSVRDRMVNVFGPDVKVVPYTYEDCSDGDTSGNEMEGEESYVEVQGASGEESNHVDEASSEDGSEEEEASVEDRSEDESDEE